MHASIFVHSKLAGGISPTAVDYASRQAAIAGAGVHFFQLDALRDPIPDGYDALTCSLFLHHLDENDALELVESD